MTHTHIQKQAKIFQNKIYSFVAMGGCCCVFFACMCMCAKCFCVVILTKCEKGKKMVKKVNSQHAEALWQISTNLFSQNFEHKQTHTHIHSIAQAHIYLRSH